MKQVLCLLYILFTLYELSAAQPSGPKLYSPELDAVKQINEAVVRAKAENKHVLVQVGGNWCPWCIKLHQFIQQHHSLDSLVNADYILVHLNYSKENKNPEAMARLDYPQRFGFPVLVILDTNGSRLNTQNTAYLEEGETYNEQKIAEFLKAWNRKAVDPATYSGK